MAGAPTPARGAPATQPTDEPGLTLTISPANNVPPQAPDHIDAHSVRMLALYVPAGSPPTPFAASGPFKATFEGDINMRLRDFLTFSAQGRGKLSLTINNKPACEASGDDFANADGNPVRLNKGKNHLVAVYESPSAGDAALRLFWATRNSAPEPVPPMVFSHVAQEGVRESASLRAGRFWIAQLRCAKCHAIAGNVDPSDKTAMPELRMDAPSLAEAGARLNKDWMAAWINDPKSLWPGAQMPKLFSSSDPAAPASQANDIAAYLATLGKPDASAPPPTDADKESGGRLFANLNCVACHVSPERNDATARPASGDRVPLGYIKAKYKPAALTRYLLNPSAHFAWTGMPNFRLSEKEAGELAAYLLSKSSQSVPAAGGDAANGQKLVRSVGCLNCHSIDADRNPPVMPRPPALDRLADDHRNIGCLASSRAERGNAPDFGLSQDQRAAITAFLATDCSSLKHDSPAEFAARQMNVLRCTACHARDGRESLLATDLDAELGELRARYPNPQQGNGEGIAPDQRAPMLTWAGEKLRPEWLAQFIGGKIDYKPRYYLRASMPGFAAQAPLLALGLVEQHGCTPNYPPYAAPDSKRASIGQTLVGKTPNASFGCVQCHAVARQAPLAPFEAPAINFMYVTSRLREDYYYRWIHNPLAIDPETKMPRFDDADGKTGVAVFDNDARKQFEAIWNFLLEGREIQPPAE